MARDSALCIGGPRHGERIAIPGTAYVNFLRQYEAKVKLSEAGFWELETVSCPVEKIRLGQHTRRLVIAPEISRQTAESYFWDVLVDAYDRHARKL